MARPIKPAKPGPKALANLKKGPGPGRPKATRKARERAATLREFGRRVAEDPAVRRSIWNRLRTHPDPQLLRLLYEYGFGKAPDTLEVKGTPTAVTIIHNLREAKGDKAE